MGKSADLAEKLYANLKPDEVAWTPAPEGLPAHEAIAWGTWSFDGVTYYVLAKDGQNLIFDDSEWDAFLDGVGKGEFNLPEDAQSRSAG